MNTFLWAVFPYLALTLFFVVPFIRMRLRPYEVTTRATSLFTRDLLGVASLLLHWGLVLLVLGHMAGLIGGIRGWASWIEAFFWLGLIGGAMTIAGSLVALIRRAVVPELRALSQSDDYLVHLFLIAIIGIALYQVIADRIWGVSYTAAAWFTSLWRFQPQPELMASAPLLSKIHITLVFAFAAYFPFTKLAHFWTLPLNYFVRPYQAMRTAGNKFRRRWESGLRSDQSILTYGVVAVVALFLAVAFFIRGPALGAGKSVLAASAGSGGRGEATAHQAYPLYVSQCARCHGLTGEGDGPGADSPRFAQPPRDLTAGGYRFISTDNGVASDEDLYRTLARGLEPAGMPAFDQLSRDQLSALVAFLDLLWEDRPEPGDPIEPGPRPEISQSLLEIGEQLYASACAACHGAEGRGDGEASEAVVDAAGNHVPPADLAAGELKTGIEPEQMYRRIAAGIPGGDGIWLMPPFNYLADEEIWALVSYLENEVFEPKMADAGNR